MSKKLFLATAFMAAFSASAQMLDSDDFNSYTPGNVSSGVTPNTTAGFSSPVLGQGGMYIINGTVSDNQIVEGTGADAAHGNYLQVTGGNDAASYNYVFKNGLGTAWAARTAGNDIVKGTFDLFTGTATNTHLSGMVIFDANYKWVIGGTYNSETGKINCLTRLKNTSTSEETNYYLSMTDVPTYPLNTWVSLGFTYNKTTGAITIKVGDVVYPVTPPAGYTIVSGLDPNWWTTFESALTGNTGPTTFRIDNYTIEASDNATLGSSETKNTKASIIAIVPNPTEDDLNILTDLKINKAEIFDMSGRKMNVHLERNKMDVKSLNSGSYIINIETKEGKTTEKFIKK